MSDTAECPRCDGTGSVLWDSNWLEEQGRCTWCIGTGRVRIRPLFKPTVGTSARYVGQSPIPVVDEMVPGARPNGVRVSHGATGTVREFPGQPRGTITVQFPEGFVCITSSVFEAADHE